jgi:hypothetical protein
MVDGQMTRDEASIRVRTKRRPQYFRTPAVTF